MIISYNWLSEYLPIAIEPEKLSRILTSIGLEVESMHPYESVKGGLKGIVCGEVLTCEKHPDADKLKITTVNIGTGDPLQIVCGASNVTAGQKVLVATNGTMLYPSTGEPFMIKRAKIRGAESNGMICAEDEIGLGDSHAGIMVLPEQSIPGTPASEMFNSNSDIIYEIGLTPNRMDAMSHLGVARDVCAYLWHHDKKELRAISPFKNNFKADSTTNAIDVTIEANAGCLRYSGISISGLTVGTSPQWLQEKLKSIGQKPINNIVDVTNFILHETGQPLHAFDADRIAGKKIIVRNANAGETFITLDDKERKLNAFDLVIADENKAMCLAGVYGGAESGVKPETTNIFLESARFDAETIRRTSLAHNLRTDAAARFEKGVDISNTVNVLKRAALLIKEIAGADISSDIIDIYPNPADKISVGIKYHYLKKLSGKNYHADTIKNILTALDFEIQKEGIDELWVNVPYSKSDIRIPADIVEEIMRIDGLDNVEIPSAITISPSVGANDMHSLLREKIANNLTGKGFSEIFTNSITNSKYYDGETINGSVKMINSLSADLDVMRPSLLETGLEVVAYNLNRKNSDLKLFEFGKTYHREKENNFREVNHLAIFMTGVSTTGGWEQKDINASFYTVKGICENIFSSAGINNFEIGQRSDHCSPGIKMMLKGKALAEAGAVLPEKLKQFGIKQPVFFADIYWEQIVSEHEKNSIVYREIPKFPGVERDLAVLVDKSVTYEDIKTAIMSDRPADLRSVRLFDIFESEKIGTDKKSMAVNFVFSNDMKTMEDADTEAMMQRIILSLETKLNAAVRK